MKKVIIFFVLIALCGFYFISMQNRGRQITRGNRKESIQEKLVEAQDEIVSKDFNTPVELIEMNNKLMGLFYSSYRAEEDISKYIETIRMLYSERLRGIVEQAQQEATLRQEIAIYTKPLVIIKSEVKETHSVMEKEGGSSKEKTSGEESVIVRVMHYTNKQDVERNYFVKKENNSWKIDGWEDSKKETKEDKTEE